MTKPYSYLVLDRQRSRRIDQLAHERYGMQGLVLMENAGRGCVDRLLQTHEVDSAVICCGTGNNGGDGLVIARHLQIAGVPVHVLMSGDRTSLTPDARANWDILAHTRIPRRQVEQLTSGDVLAGMRDDGEPRNHWIIDALLGTGAKGKVRSPLDQWIAVINAAPARRLAVDLPSGLDCDTGRADSECVRADLTCTFVALKPCFGVEPGRTLAGKVHVIDIGVPLEVVEQVLGEWRRPV